MPPSYLIGAMKKTLLLVTCASLLATPVSAEAMIFDIEGTFTQAGLVENGSFAGTFAYELETVDSNPLLSNVGTFELAEFEINVFDGQANQIETLTEENSVGSISLAASSAETEASTYEFFTTPDTEADGNAFFNYGSFNIMFDFPAGGEPNVPPQVAPGGFQSGQFSPATGDFQGIINPQAIADAAIEPASPIVTPPPQTEPPVSTPEHSSWLGLSLASIAIGVVKFKK